MSSLLYSGGLLFLLFLYSGRTRFSSGSQTRLLASSDSVRRVYGCWELFPLWSFWCNLPPGSHVEGLNLLLSVFLKILTCLSQQYACWLSVPVMIDFVLNLILFDFYIVLLYMFYCQYKILSLRYQGSFSHRLTVNILIYIDYPLITIFQ